MSSASKEEERAARHARKTTTAEAPVGAAYTASDIARLRNGAPLPARASTQGGIRRLVGMKKSNALYRAEHDRLATKVFLSMLTLAVLVFLSLGVMGAAGQSYPYSSAYQVYSPVQVAQALYEHAYNGLAVITHAWPAHSNEWIRANVPGYWAVIDRAGVIGITLICAVLLAVSGMLYQNVFKNPIAGPGMLGVSSGVNLGMMLMVAFYSGAAPSMVGTRYALCYAFGAAILVFVMVAGRKLSWRGKPFDIVTMLLIGSILSQLLGFIVSYMTLFVMDESDYATFYTMSQMLAVDTSIVSWVALGIATLVSMVPVVVNLPAQCPRLRRPGSAHDGALAHQDARHRAHLRRDYDLGRADSRGHGELGVACGAVSGARLVRLRVQQAAYRQRVHRHGAATFMPRHLRSHPIRGRRPGYRLGGERGRDAAVRGGHGAADEGMGVIG